MRLTVTATAAGLPPTDVLVDVDDDATVSDLTTALCRAVGARETASAPTGSEGMSGSVRLSPAEDRVGLYVRGRRVEPELEVSASGLVDGACVDLGHPSSQVFTPPTAGWQLHVVSGPDAGGVRDLPVGEHEIGRSTAMVFSDPAMSRRHAVLTVTPQGATVADLGSANGTAVEALLLEPGEQRPVEPGELIALGDTVVTIARGTPSDAAIEPGAPGWLSFVRAPRMLPPTTPTTVVFPRPPTPPTKRRFPLATLLGPLVLGLVMFTVLKSPLYLLMALGSPAMALSNQMSDKRATAKKSKAEMADHAVALERTRARLTEVLAAEQRDRRQALPDAAAVLLTATLPTRRLWERRRTDLDALHLRVGTADRPSRVTVELPQGYEGTDTAAAVTTEHTAWSVPVGIALRNVGVLGVAGPDAVLDGVLRSLLVQLAVHHPPRDLALTLLTDKERSTWAWLRWLPHARLRGFEAPTAQVGNDPDTVTARVAELSALVASRQEVTKNAGRIGPDWFSAEVVVLDGARDLRAVPGLAKLLQEGPEVGVYAICADPDERFLPEACRGTLVLDADGAHLTVRQTGEETVSAVLAEPVSEPYADTVARALSPLRDVTGEQDAVVLPDSARLLDELSLEPPTAEALRARWQLGGRTTTMVIGAGLDGSFALDLRTDGPHGLIAGTTGSGKSELLQTMIASLAVANRPDAMNFVLVDYKGGSAFKDCVALPHTVGMVTDLDNHLVERALTSLGAELKHREHWLADAGMKDIDDYIDLQAREPHREPMPRLLIVIDEFASMARELPDFVSGLVNIAQRGRSLGIHLILATQRPSGVVSPEIRANTNLRISLRVTDAADSNDVLEAADAARIPKSAPGRGFARLGAGSLVPFQSGRVGGRRPGVRPVHVAAPFVAPVGWHTLGHLPPSAPVRHTDDDVELTDLSVLVGCIIEAAQQEGLPPQRSPWLPALSGGVLLADLPPVQTPAEPGLLPAFPYGVQDLPAEQLRATAAFDAARSGHLLVIGAARSGRSQLLRTLATSAAQLCSTEDLHLYGLDCGNGALLPLQDLPHCGAIVSRSQPERAARLLGRIAAEMERRQGLLAEGGFADLTEQRRAAAPADRLPHLLLLLDRWEGFTGTLGEIDGGRLTEVVLNILREGASVGVHAVLVGDRTLGMGRIASLTDNKIALRMTDKSDYSLIGLNARKMPDTVEPGRAFTAGDGLEVQVALLSEDDSAQGQAAVIAEVAEATRVRDEAVPRARRPFRVDVLPQRITYAQAAALVLPDAPKTFAMVGVGGDELQAVGTDWLPGPGFVVGGPARSGRSTALAVIGQSILDRGGQLVIAAPRASALRAFEGRPGVLGVVTDPAAGQDVWAALLGNAAPGPLTVLIDDGEVLRDSAAGELFRDIVKGQAGEDRFLVLGGNAEGICTGLSGWQVEVKKSRQGLLLSPQGTSDGDLIGVRLPRSVVGQPVTPGRGLLHRADSRLMSVAVPTV